MSIKPPKTADFLIVLLCLSFTEKILSFDFIVVESWMKKELNSYELAPFIMFLPQILITYPAAGFL